MSTAEGIPIRRASPSRALLVLTVLLVAANLRPAITVVGPVLDRIGEDTGMAPAALGVLGAVPVFAFGVVSPLVHRLSERWGLERTILGALIVLGLGTALRSLPAGSPASDAGPGSATPGMAALFGGTVLLSGAIGVGNVLVPALVRRDFPGHVPLMTGLYTAVLVGCAALGSGLAVPAAELMGWRLALGTATSGAVVAAVVWLVRMARPPQGAPTASQEAGSDTSPAGTEGPTPIPPAGPSASPAGTEGPAGSGTGSANATGPASHAGPVGSARSASHTRRPSNAGSASHAESASHAGPGSRARSLWSSSVAWQVTAYFGTQSALFYTMLTWFPSIQGAHGADEARAGLWLAVFQAVGIAVNLLLGPLMQRSADQRAIAVGLPAMMVTALLGMVLAPGLMPLWAILGGLSSGGSLLTALSLISLRARDARDAGRLSGMAQGVGYLFAGMGPVLAGALFQAAGSWTPVLVLAMVIAATQALMGALAGRPVFAG